MDYRIGSRLIGQALSAAREPVSGTAAALPFLLMVGIVSRADAQTSQADRLCCARGMRQV